jgi:beta-lactam-binding protein with PASTA domain
MLLDLEEFRKNPAVIFNYTMSKPYDRSVAGDSDVGVVEMHETKVIPSGALVKAERTLPAKRKVAHKPEMTREEYRATHKRASRTSVLIGIFSVVLFLVVVLVFMWNYLLRDIFNPPVRESITIPNFVGRRFDDLLRISEYEQLFSFSVDEYRHSEEHAEGIVIEQIRPTPNRQMNAPDPGRTIPVALIVSRGEAPPIEMLDFVGRHFNDAFNWLNSRGLDLDVILQPVSDDNITQDFIIETIPKVGEALLRGNTIIIRYSAGPDVTMVEVPSDMVGRQIAALESRFDALRLIPDPHFLPDEAEAGTVLWVQRAGEEVPIQTRIRIEVSQGPRQMGS